MPSKEYYEKNKKEISEKRKRIYQEDEEYRNNILKYSKQYRKDHLEEKKEYLKEYKKNKLKNDPSFFEKYNGRYKELQQKYRKDHKQDILDKVNRKNKDDIKFRITNNLRSRLRKVISHKYGRTMELVCCSIPDLMKHLENQFTEGMTWENYGKWHIDHIRPCASFNLLNEEEQRQCFHYSNLQPLWAEDNLRKKDKW